MSRFYRKLFCMSYLFPPPRGSLVGEKNIPPGTCISSRRVYFSEAKRSPSGGGNRLTVLSIGTKQAHPSKPHGETGQSGTYKDGKPVVDATFGVSRFKISIIRTLA